MNAEFANQLSDHDPQVARFLVNAAPEVDAGGPYSVAEGASITLSATGSDPEGDSLSYAWDLDNDGDFETPGQTVTYTAGDGPATPVVQVEASDGSTAGTAAVTISISNVAPTASFVAPTTSFAGFPFTLSLTGATDPSAADVTAGLQYAFDCGDGAGYGPFGSSSSRSCPTSNVGIRTVRGQVRDKDGGVSEYTATVGVVVTFDSLCALTKAYSSKPAVATALCALLNTAEHAKTRIVREAALLPTESGSSCDRPAHTKAFTNEEGDTLIRLSRAL